MNVHRAGLVSVCLFIFAANGWSQHYTINTVAGTNRLLDGGNASAAPLRAPFGVALDGAKNLFIADRDDNRVRKVTPAGVISTYAGIGLPAFGGDRGPAINAALNGPYALAMDSKGNLFVADRGNAVVRRISADGTINTVAGNGRPGYGGDNGPALDASIDPTALAMDGHGNLYIGDGLNYRIRKVDTNGVITSIAGVGTPGSGGNDGPAVMAAISFVPSLVFDSSGNLYFSDAFNAVIRKIDSTGTITLFAGVGFGSPGTIQDGFPATMALVLPWGLSCDGSTSLYVADTYTNEIRRIDLPSGLMYTTAGDGNAGFRGDNGIASNAEFNFPAGIAAASGGDPIFVADLGNTRVRKIAANVVTTAAGTSVHDGGPATSAFLNAPQGVAVDSSGNVVVADTGDFEARRFKAGGNINAIGQLMGKPAGVAAAADGSFYVSDSEPLILKIAPGGTTSIIAGNSKTGFSGDGGAALNAMLNAPQGLTVDANTNIYIADSGNNRVRKVDSSGNISTFAGSGDFHFSGDNGPAVAAGMGPADVALDSAGDLLVADAPNHRIRKITPNGNVSTVVGNGLPGYAGDGGPATAAQLTFPTGIAVDHAGNIYIADAGNFAVRRVTPNGLITTIAGSGLPLPSTGDGGPAIAAQLDPFSVAVDPTGTVYVTDFLNDRVRSLTPVVVTATTVAKVSGDAQSGTVSTVLAQPLVLKVADSGGAGVPGVVVTFTVSPDGAATLNPSPAITLNDGTVTVSVALGATAQSITIKAFVTGLAGSAGTVSFTATAIPNNSPTISAGGITSAGLSTPPVVFLSSNAIVSIFGDKFAAAGTARQVGPADLVDGKIPTNLAGVCAEFNTVRAPIFGVYPGQLNVQVPTLAPGNVSVQVIINCDTPDAVASPPIQAAVQAAAPEFFYFAHNQDGHDPIAAVNAVTGAYVGATGLIAGANFVPAKEDDILTLYATGFGATDPSFDPGVLPGAAAQVTAPVVITFGGVKLEASDILYVGVTQDAGLYQLNLRVPKGVPDGDQPLVITIGGVASPSNAFITVKKPAS